MKRRRTTRTWSRLLAGGISFTLLSALLPALAPFAQPPTAAAADGQTPESCLGTVSLNNGGFEAPTLPAQTFRLLSEGVVPGWDTTATDNLLELWSTGFLDVPAHTGSQFAELNATQNSTLYQIASTAPGQTLNWSLAHRGRSGVDVMTVEFGPPGGPYVQAAELSDGQAWRVHSGTYLVPEGQTQTEMRFRAVRSSGIDASFGNFLDSVVFGTEACIVSSKSITNLTTPTATTAQVGDRLSYTVTATNGGGRPASSVVLTDAIPAGTTYVPGSLRIVSSPAPGQAGAKTDAVDADSAQFSGGQVRFALGNGATGTTGGTLQPGDTVAVSFRVEVQPSAASGSIVNQSNTTFLGDSIASRSLSNRVTTPVAPAADLEISKASSPITQAAGGEVTYRANVTNRGPDTARSISVVDTLPDGLQFVSAVPPAGTTCDVSGQVVTCTADSLAVGENIAVPIRVRIPADHLGSVVNTVMVSAATTDHVRTNNTATAGTSVTASADLSLTKTVDPTDAVAGTDVTYTLTASNAGPSTARSVSIGDSLPSGMRVVSATADNTNPCTTTDSTVDCRMGDVAPGTSRSVTVVARVDSAVTDNALVNTGFVNATTIDPDQTNNRAVADLEITRSADLSIIKQGPSEITAGRTVTYTAVVSNAGPSDAADVEVSDPAPDGLTLLSSSSTLGTCNGASCELGALASGKDATVTFEYAVDPGRLTPIVNSASASSTTPDPDSADLTSDVRSDVVTSADLRLRKAQSSSTLVRGTEVTYTLTATNLGPSTARDVEVMDVLQEDLTFRGSTDGCTAGGGTVTCRVDELASGAAVTFTFVAFVSASGTGPIRNSATVSATTPDPDDSNNESTVEADGQSYADLAVFKSTSSADRVDPLDQPLPPVAGEEVRYTLTAHNFGSSDANDVSVTDTLPAGITFVRADDSRCTHDAGTVTCDLALAANTSATLTFVGRVDAAVTGTSANTASIASSSVPDLTPRNNSATSTVTVATLADLRVDLEPENQPALAGDEVDFTLVVTNDGPSTARDVVVTSRIPEGVTPDLDSADASCVISGRTITCTIAQVRPGETIEAISLHTLIDPGLADGSDLAFSAAVGSQTPEEDPTDNTDDVTVTVGAEADLDISKRVSPDPVIAGSAATYVVTVTNNGPSTATAIEITDDLSIDFALDAASTGLGDCDLDVSRVVCIIDSLAPGTSVDVTIEGSIWADAEDEIANDAFVTSAVTDPNPDNDVVELVTPIVQQADLRITKDGPSTVVAGQRITYTATILNTGPSNAADVTFTDQLPAGLVSDGVTVNESDGDCRVDAQLLVTCDFDDLAATDSRRVTISARVDPALSPDARIQNTASVSSSTPGSNDQRVSNTVDSDVETLADVTVTKLPVTVPIAGGTARYTIQVTNEGPSQALNVVIDDQTPPGTTLVEFESSDVATECSGVADAFRCRSAALAPGGTVAITAIYTLDADSAGDTLENIATAFSDTPDPSPENNGDVVTQTVQGLAVLSIDKRAPEQPVVAGTEATFTIDIDNRGPSDARELRVTDSLPDGMTPVRATASGEGECTIVDQEVTCVWQAAAPGQQTVSVAALVDADAADGSRLVNTATATSTDSTTTVSDSAAVAVTTSADLMLTKSAIAGEAVPGGPIGWTITVGNDGPSTALEAVIVDSLPADVDDATAVADAGRCEISDGVVRCTLDPLAPDEQAVVEITGTLSPLAERATLSNTASVVASAPDPDTSNNADSVGTPVAGADLKVTKTSTEDSVRAGSDVEWIIRVANDGPATARTVVIGDALPVTVRDVTATTSTGTCSVSAGFLSCALGAIGPDGEATVRVTGSLSASASGELVNTATATTSDELDPTDNTSTVRTPIVTQADLSVVKSLHEGGVTAGGSVAWQLTIRNDGPADAVDVRLVDQLPPALTGVKVSDTDDLSCAVDSGSVACAIAVLESGAEHSLMVRATLDPDFRGDLVNVADVRSATPDSVPENNSARVSTNVDGASSAEIAKVALADRARLGDELGYQITVTTDGPSTTRDLVVEEKLPPGATVLRAEVSAGYYDAVTRMWNIGTLRPGASAVLDIVVSFDRAGPATNEVVLAGGDSRVSSSASAEVLITDGEPPLLPLLPPTGGSPAWWMLPLAVSTMLTGLAMVTFRRVHGWYSAVASASDAAGGPPDRVPV